MKTALAVVALLALVAGSQATDVMAIYFGDWHPNPDMENYHGQGWTEWELVVNAQPRYKGHMQPNTPLTAPGFGLTADESSPTDMAQKVAAAQAHGIDGFLFDWYWYAEKGPANGTGGPFLNEALDSGFLPLKNNDFKFAVHLCNQDWVDIHPAKKGWHSTGRPVSDDFKVLDSVAAKELLIFDGIMSPQVYMGAFDFAIKNYFHLPNYYRAPTTLANGTVAMCPYFSIYQLDYLVAGVGGLQQAGALIQQARAAAEAAGSCLHLSIMLAGSPTRFDNIIDAIKPDSTVTYCIMKVTSIPTFPESDYITTINDGITAWGNFRDHLKTKNLAFAPSLSVAWDSSPRTLIMDPYENVGYPWGSSIHSTNETWVQALQNAEKYMTSTCSGGSPTKPGADWCPPLFLNAWNEWSEGAYLEPDQRFQWGRLEGVKQVFGNK